MLKIAMDDKRNRRVQARRICKMTGLWRHSAMIQRLQHTRWSHWCSTLTSAWLENPQHLRRPNPNSAQLRKVFAIGQSVAERDEERRRGGELFPSPSLAPKLWPQPLPGICVACSCPGVGVTWISRALRFILCPARKELLWFWSASSSLGGQNIPCALNSTGCLLLISSIISPSVNNVCWEAFWPHFSRESIMRNSKDGNTNPKIFH